MKRNPSAFLQLIWTQPFVEMRAHFVKLAHFCNQDASAVSVPNELIQEMHALRERLSSSQELISQATPSLHPAMDRIEDRQSKAFALYSGNDAEREQFVRVATDQIEDYACLIKSVLDPAATE